mmetsp:Transcript_40073/g.66991  ORF Transcript_40073/g.66991 Transcript_40073/m.66991 type:complete len:179 (+) Transcript_40073:1075-1611(+)
MERPASPPVVPRRQGMREYRDVDDYQQVYKLYERCNPRFVRWVEGLRPIDFRIGYWEKVAMALRKLLRQVDDRRVVIERNDKIVAYARLVANMQGTGPHTLQMMVDPDRWMLYGPLLSYINELVQAYPPTTVVTWAPNYQPKKHEALRSWNMEVSSDNSCMVRGSGPIPLAPDMWVAE